MAGAKFCSACASALDAKPLAPGDPPVRSVLGERYEMGLALGETPYGRAFIAWDRAANEARVLVSSPGAQAYASELANPAEAEQSVRELAGRSLKPKASTEGAATALELLAVSDRLFTVFEQGPGLRMVGAESLRDSLESRDRPRQAEETLGLFAPIAAALEAFHATGRIHGRVSPHTVFVSAGAPATLLDIPALQDGSDPDVVALLDEPYAAPELLEGVRQAPASDVYALAATIFHSLTARSPDGLSKHEIVSNAQHAGAPAAAAQALAQALAEKPGERFGAVGPFWQAYRQSYEKPAAAQWPKAAAVVLLLLAVIGGGVFLGLQYGSQLLAMLQGGPTIVLEGPSGPVAWGGDAEVRWEAPSDATVKLDGVEVAPKGRTVIEALEEDRELVLTVELADGGVETRRLELDVAGAPAAPTLDISFEGPADPIPYGGSGRLNWNVRGATDVMLDGRPVDPVGSFLVSGLLADETHTLEAVAADGTRETREAFLAVAPGSKPELSGGVRRDPAERRIPVPPPSQPKPVPPLVVSFVPSTLSVPRGGDVELRWEAVNARDVTLDGSAVPEIGSRRISGLQRDREFILGAVGLDGNREERRLRIRVVQVGAPSVVAFMAEPESVLPGSTATLRWEVEGDITDLTIDPAGSVRGAQGTTTVRPDRTTEYKLTAKGPGGSTTATTIVRVREPAPVIEFRADPPSVSCSGATQLVWNVQNASSVNIDPEPGRVAASGSERVRPGRERRYTLTARGPGGVAYKEVAVEMEYSGPSTGTILVKKRVQSGITFEVPGFPCVPVEIGPILGDPLVMVQEPTARGGRWVGYFKSNRAGNRDVESTIRWTVKR